MRYRSMAAFAADLRAAVEGRPVSARPPSMLQRGWRWARRFPVVGTALVGGIAVVVTALVFLGLLVHEQRERSALLARTDMGRILVDAEALWPATPATIPRAREWLARAATVASVTKFDQLGDEEHGLIRIVAERIRTIEAAAFASIGSSSAEARWNAACRAIEDHESYGGLQLEPQFGLLPLGADPDSRLWEFAHVLSGEVPARGAEGRLHLAPESGIVLVLVPGGDFDIGAQRQPSGPNYDPEATSFESPVRHVSVPPFFLSKYEMTQAQWFRLTGEQPSYYRTPQGLPGLLPVEQVSWNDAASSLLRFGLRLPDEREWEFAARAATTHRFFFEESRLAEYANVHDATAVRRSQGRLEYSLDSKGRAISLHGGAHFELVEDGYQYTAPVDRFRPNPWGFHGMVGNVREWCGDDYAPYPGHPQESEYRGYSAAGFKVFRGGGYHRPLREARLSLRGSDHPRFLYKALGMRAARSID